MEDIKNNPIFHKFFLPGYSGICLLGTEQKTEAAAASHPQERYIEKQQWVLATQVKKKNLSFGCCYEKVKSLASVVGELLRSKWKITWPP